MSVSIAFRKRHVIQLLSGYEEQQGPLDYFVSCYFRAHKALGSKDRAFISETVYALVRWQLLYDALGSSTWEQHFELFEKSPPEQSLNDEAIPLEARLSFPKTLFQEIVDSWGKEKAI